MSLKTIQTLEDIEKFMYNSGDCFYNISNDLALYYMMVWGDRKEQGTKEEYNMLAVMKQVEGMINLTTDEKQEIWDTVVHLSLEYNDNLYLTMGDWDLPADYIGNYSLVREWDKRLMRYNYGNLNNRWVKVHNFGGVPRWEEFKEFYEVYKEKLNRKHYMLLTDEEIGKMVVDMKPIIENITYKEGYGYEGKRGEVIEKVSLYDIDDLIESFEEKIPNILNKREYNWLTKEEMEEFRVLCWNIPVGLKRFGDIIFDYKN